jgi:lysophospholipase L1-like esterase
MFSKMIKARHKYGWFAAVLLAWAGIAAAEEKPEKPFFLRDGDRVVIMGDSITEQNLYSAYLELWTITRFPSWNISFRNVGILGDRASRGNARFARDVLPHKPTVLLVNLGMNDGGGGDFDGRLFQNYTNGLQGIADQARAHAMRVAWVSPQPVEKQENGPAIAGYAATLEKFAEGMQTVAEANHGLFVDLFHPCLRAMDKGRASDPLRRVMGGLHGDPVHPGPPGHALMAASILQGMNFPVLVSTVEIDAAQGKIVKAEQCQVTDLEIGTNGTIRFTQLDSALPFFPEQAIAILPWARILQDLNVYELKVTGLKQGFYEIRLGGKAVMKTTDKGLAHGLNLTSAALNAGPLAVQVREIIAAVAAKDDYFHGRIFDGVTRAGDKTSGAAANRKANEMPIDPSHEPGFEQRLAEMPKYDEAIRKALVMHPHHVELVWSDPMAGRRK